uniref:Putative secreted peptide n=1 Tax=Anopheles braziliensis TaxID=58242 RepID=A0A2M3ZP65_9DIPT
MLLLLLLLLIVATGTVGGSGFLQFGITSTVSTRPSRRTRAGVAGRGWCCAFLSLRLPTIRAGCGRK